MSIAEIITLIQENGIMFVLCCIFIYVIIKVINVIFDGVKKSKEERKEHQRHDKLLETRSEIGEEIQILIKNFINQFEYDRIQVIEFSNSVTSVAYLPFRYMTCNYEACNLGIHYTGSHIDHLPTSLFTTFLSKLKAVPYFEFDINEENRLMGGAMYDLMQSTDVTNSLCAMLSTVNGKSVGYVSIQKSSKFTEVDFKNIQKLASQLSALLCVVDR